MYKVNLSQKGVLMNEDDVRIFVESIDVKKIIDECDVRKMAKEINYKLIVEELEIEKLISKILIRELVKYIDMDKITEEIRSAINDKLNLKSSARRINLKSILSNAKLKIDEKIE